MVGGGGGGGVFPPPEIDCALKGKDAPLRGSRGSNNWTLSVLIV